MRAIVSFVLISFAFTVANWAESVLAQVACCKRCGCQATCQKVCRLVCEEKQVEVLCWGSKCEDFCVPGHSKPGCQHCETVCADCEAGKAGTPHTEPKGFVWYDWFPGGAKIYTRTKLMRKTEKVTVPSYKWVVEDLCPECTAKLELENAAAVARLPADSGVPLTR
jgi:hypothetical protein